MNVLKYWKIDKFRKEVKVNFILFSFVTYFLIFFKVLMSDDAVNFSFTRLLLISLVILPVLYVASFFMAKHKFDNEEKGDN